MSEHNENGGDQEGKKDEPTFTIFVNNNPFTTRKHELAGAQIKALAAVPGDYELFQVQGDNTVPIGNEQVVHINNGDHFRAIPAGTFGCNDATA